jgi:hypothetical protein
MLTNGLAQGAFKQAEAVTAEAQERIFMKEFGGDEDVNAKAVADLRQEFQKFDANGKGESPRRALVLWFWIS